MSKNEYQLWLNFFFSIQQSINNQPVIKSRLPNGNMLIAGSKPKQWQVELQPQKAEHVNTILAHTNHNKEKALYQMRLSLEECDEKEFKEATQLMNKSEQEEKQILTFLGELHNKKKKVREKLFQIRREVYLLETKKAPRNQLDSLLRQQQNLLEQEQAEEREAELRKKTFTLSQEKVLKKGPAPNVPNLPPFSLTLPRKIHKLDYEKNENMKKKQKGGKKMVVEVIKLDHV